MQSRAFQRSIACAVLLAYVAGGTPVIPVMAAAVAAFDGDHTVMMVESEVGTCLVLQHRQGCSTPRVKDHASPLAQALVALCRLDSHQDHEFTAAHFTSGFVPLRDDVPSEGRDATHAAAQPPILVLAEELWCKRDTTRVPEPPDNGADDALRRQGRRALASVQLLV